MKIYHPKPNGKKIRGLGDAIALVTKSTGIDKVAKFAAKAVGSEDCGCNKRQDQLNNIFPFKNSKK
jgi:hypothetical protein